MIPVYQTRTVRLHGTGNCFNACVASLLERPLRDVCDVLPDNSDYWGTWNRWLKPLGLRIAYWPLQSGVPEGWAIASGYGDRVYPEGHSKAGERILHAVVVFNGEVVHDPFPAAKCFGEIRYYWTLEELESHDG